jgi:hypothetical protein
LTRDLERDQRLARLVESDAAFVNGLVASDPRLPFDGGQAQRYGRELSSCGIKEFTDNKEGRPHLGGADQPCVGDRLDSLQSSSFSESEIRHPRGAPKPRSLRRLATPNPCLARHKLVTDAVPPPRL